MAEHPRSHLAAVTYLVFFAPAFTEHKEDPFVMYHMHQAIGLLVFALSLQGIISIIGHWGLDPNGWRVWPVRAVLLYELAIGVRHALRGEALPLPWIGKYAARLFA